MQGLFIKEVLPGSIAEEIGLEPGDCLSAVNGHLLNDIIDFHFYEWDEEELVIEGFSADGECWEAAIDREEGESLGLVFASPAPVECGNQCIFCFVHQLPKGLRRQLYVKDEDYRLSFLYGNYVTLANVNPEDLKRIKYQRLSPLYISIHATDAAVRRQLLGKTEQVPIMETLRDLAEAGIDIHTQIVLCPSVNDGEILRTTIHDLSVLSPRIRSVAIVPVGLTRHREKLPPIQPVSEQYADRFVAEWESEGRKLSDRLGEPFLFLSDEWYIRSGRDFPPYETYGDFPQLENGVGMIPLFLHESREILASALPCHPRSITVVSGLSASKYLAAFCSALSLKTGVDIRLQPVVNHLFGESVTVSGLVSGRDILSALKDVDLGDELLIPDVMLKEFEGLFLDDLAPADIEAALHLPVTIIESTPSGLYRAISEF